MTSFGKTLVAGIVIVLAGIAIAYISTTGTAPAVPSEPVAATTTDSATSTVPGRLASDFESEDYGFAFNYKGSWTAVPQNFMDTTESKTLILLKSIYGDSTLRVSALTDPKTGKPIAPKLENYEKALMNDAVYDGSGAHPKSFGEFKPYTAFVSEVSGEGFRFSSIRTGLFEGVLGYSYYFMTPKAIIRFALTSRGVDWTNPSFDPENENGHLALKGLLAGVGFFSPQLKPILYNTPYADPSGAFSLKYSDILKLNTKFSYDLLGPDKKLSGIAFTFPQSFFAGTNLSSESYISVEKNPYAPKCTPGEFVSSGTTTPSDNEVGSPWIVGTSADAAAGNRYDERIYAAKTSSGCYGIRLFLHSGAIENFDAGAVQQFDKSLYSAIQDGIVSSFKFLK